MCLIVRGSASADALTNDQAAKIPAATATCGRRRLATASMGYLQAETIGGSEQGYVNESLYHAAFVYATSNHSLVTRIVGPKSRGEEARLRLMVGHAGEGVSEVLLDTGTCPLAP